jgi:hypothetical protein
LLPIEDTTRIAGLQPASSANKPVRRESIPDKSQLGLLIIRENADFP